MHNPPVVLLAAAVLLALAGCAMHPLESERADRSAELLQTHLRTDSTSYTLKRSGGGWETQIGLEFTNPLRGTIYVVNCNGGLALSLERLEGSSWRTVWAPVLQRCLGPPIQIPAGSTFRTTYPIWGAEPNRNTAPEFSTAALDGTYRLMWSSLVLNYDDRRQNFGDPVPEALRVSNAFELRQER
jgi:hypothetical protein